MSLENRIETTDADFEEEVRYLVETGGEETLERFARSLPGDEVLEELSDADLERLCAGDGSFLTPEQLAALCAPIPPEPLALPRSGDPQNGTARRTLPHPKR